MSQSLKKLLTRLTICSLCIMTICNFGYFRLDFEGGIEVLIASVPGHLFSLHFW